MITGYRITEKQRKKDVELLNSCSQVEMLKWFVETWEERKMNDDLIRRSVLMQSLRNNVLVDVTPNLQQAIAEQPTAYDVDKVVEQLEQDSQNIELIYPTDQGYDYEDAIGIDINRAKQIVKCGGIE